MLVESIIDDNGRLYGGGDKHMAKKERRPLVTMEELFANEELHRARALYVSYNDADHDVFRREVCDHIVKPKLIKINEYTGHDISAEYWAYCLECYLGAMSKEEAATVDHWNTLLSNLALNLTDRWRCKCYDKTTASP
jgi:hypothetical protein